MARNLALILLILASIALGTPAPAPDVALGNDGNLNYVTSENGDRIPDFSTAGYMGGDATIPNAPVRVVVTSAEGDNTARIQSAIDYVATLEPDKSGLRGAVLLKKGRYQIAGSIRIAASGVVLRGEGASEKGTVLVATGLDRRSLIRIAGASDRSVDSTAIAIADEYVPVSATRLRLRDTKNLKVGDTILIRRASTTDWIKTINMDNMGGERHAFTWKPGSRDILWDRTITKIEGDQITIDGAITTAIDAKLAPGTVAKYAFPGRITQVGVENLRCDSTFDPNNPKDEDHAWFGVTINAASDAWVRQVTFLHFAGSAVAVFDSARRITVEDCKLLVPISEIAGQRRQSFFTSGQQTLFQRCYSQNGRHDFAVGFCAAGPNAFVQCEADDALDESGPIDSWASGVLYDNVDIDGNQLSFRDRAFREAGAGWSAANCVAWQCSAAVVNNFAPPGATNWVFGTMGQFSGNGQWSGLRESIKPDSLYYAQLAERIGNSALDRAQIMRVGSDASSSPSIEVAKQMSEEAKQPAPLLSDWIDQAGKRNPIPTDAAGAKSIDEIAVTASQPPKTRKPISIVDGRIQSEGKVLTGGRQRIKWWAGGVRPMDLANPEPSPTRFVPGRIVPGLTDDLDQLTDQMVKQNKVALEHHYGLWYDTRDADHERMRRMDGNVTLPFYEYPFARSGRDLAWDGLSKYDLTKYNPWYFNRLKQLAEQCDRKGLVLIQQHFFQHNILEAGAHWASSPWRSANNINDTGFPEPPSYAGDKRVFVAEQFYDLSNATRRKIFRDYIRHCLENTADNTNTIHLTSAEYTGPLEFTQFWIDTIAEWEKETGKNVITGLSATKDVQDAILADPVRSKVVDVIDIKYWWYQTDGQLYAPKGGQNLAPRQHARLTRLKGSSPEQIERAVKEYREKYPDKAVIVSTDEGDRFDDAVKAVGGSL